MDAPPFSESNVNIRPASSLHPGCMPSPGIYTNVPFSLYVSLAAMNHSTLKRMKKSPAHFKYERAPSVGDGARLGTAAHTLLFEPANFKPIQPPINPKTGNPFGMGTKAWEEYAAANPGALIMSDDEVRVCREQVSALKSHATLGPPLIDDAGINEVTLVWVDEETTVLCKARLDRYVAGFGTIDLKTVDVSIGSDGEGFARQAINLSYHSAQAFYQRGMKACGLKDTSFVFGVVESAAPFGIKVYELGDATLRCGEVLVSEWMGKLAKCLRTGEWPGYHDGITTLDAPEWYLKRFFPDGH